MRQVWYLWKAYITWNANHVGIAEHSGSRIFLLFNFRFGQEVKVNLGSPFCNYLTIDDLYNGAKIVNLPLVVVEIWFLLNVKLSLPVWTGSKVKLGSLFYKYLLTINDLYNGAKSVHLPLVVVNIWICFNIKLWFIVIRYLMTSSWRHKFYFIYLLCSILKVSFYDVGVWKFLKRMTCYAILKVSFYDVGVWKFPLFILSLKKVKFPMKSKLINIYKSVA